MASRFQAVPLVASPMYSNAVAWSNENLVAVASGQLVTILNPALPFGPKGSITIPTSKPFPIGLIESKDLLCGCMLPTCLSRDVRPCVRSISWSPLGVASNAGCLLAVCTTEGVVMVYRSPFCEISAEWVKVIDISDMLHAYFTKIRYGEANFPSSQDCEVTQFDVQQGQNIPSISAEQYVCRSAMLSSVVVAWSPPMLDSKSSRRCCILAIGAKSGTISFWRVHEPQCYSIARQNEPPVASLIGLIQAHTSWITAITWSKSESDGSLQLLLSTGSSDGSVKVWRGYTDDLLKSTEDGHASFSLLKEVIDVGSGPASVLALVVPDTSPHKIILAVGKGSGSLQVWTYDTSIDQFDVFGPHYAHDQIVTGLAWAYDGRCLYSCSQDNSLRSWIIKGNSLHEVPLPSNILGAETSTDVPNVSDACFGVAVSPANLVVAVVRSFDVNLLNPMYQARSQKAVVEFFWIGGQKLQIDVESDEEKKNIPGFPNMDLVNWGNNILWSLHQYKHLDKPVVVWDMIAVLSAFKQSEADYVEQILVKWLISDLGFELGPCLETVLPRVCEGLSNLTSRQLHLLNIISRHVILKGNMNGSESEEVKVWFKLVEMCEKEVRERLIGCIFFATLSGNGNWQEVGLAHMRRWLANNEHAVKDYVKVLASEVDKRYYVAKEEEECSYCSAAVPFEDTEVAFCQADKYNVNDETQKHKIARCGVSMIACSPLSPTWFCVSCNRWVSSLAPESLFTLLSYPPPTEKKVQKNGEMVILSNALCPFCGILLQKLQPDFLLSTTTV